MLVLLLLVLLLWLLLWLSLSLLLYRGDDALAAPPGLELVHADGGVAPPEPGKGHARSPANICLRPPPVGMFISWYVLWYLCVGSR